MMPSMPPMRQWPKPIVETGRIAPGQPVPGWFRARLSDWLGSQACADAQTKQARGNPKGTNSQVVVSGSMATVRHATVLGHAVIIICLVLLASCGNGSIMATSFPSPPEGAVLYDGQGPLATRADLVLADGHAKLREHHAKPGDILRYQLAPGTDWDDVVRHYDQGLGSAWQPESHFAEHQTAVGYWMRIWNHANAAFSVLYIPAPAATGSAILIVMPPKAQP